MPPTPHGPWIYLEFAAAVLSAVTWLAIPALWLSALPMTRAARLTAVAVCVSAGLSMILALLGPRAAGAVAVNHVFGAAAFLAFVVTLGVVFRQVAVRRRASPPTGPVNPDGAV